MGTFPTGLSETLNFNPINIYPNPAVSSVNITMPENISKATIQLIDNTGRIIKQIIVSGHQNTLTINIQDLTSGIYTIMFQLPHSIATKKIVVINN
ncbi:MAG: T9SS type A sorting domain-containing protein [Sphingobacteriales bacterium JAD_PAG50586_3]|nr:MAG: T9SS type A sorting domain-containing protein [Sphingobacteriales bacterium JAD_PAG50586_3]